MTDKNMIKACMNDYLLWISYCIKLLFNTASSSKVFLFNLLVLLLYLNKDINFAFDINSDDFTKISVTHFTIYLLLEITIRCSTQGPNSVCQIRYKFNWSVYHSIESVEPITRIQISLFIWKTCKLYSPISILICNLFYLWCFL